MQHPKSLLAMQDTVGSKRQRAIDTNTGTPSSLVHPSTSINEIVHCSLDPEHAPFRLANSSFAPTVIFSKSHTDTQNVSAQFTLIDNAPLFLMFPIGPAIPICTTFCPVPLKTTIQNRVPANVWAWDPNMTTDWFRSGMLPGACTMYDKNEAELPLQMDVKSLGHNLGNTVSSLAFRGVTCRYEMKGQSATSLIMKGERQTIRIEDPYDIHKYTDLDLDNLTSSPKYRAPPTQMYQNPITITWGPEACERFLHKPPGHGLFEHEWYTSAFNMHKGDLNTYVHDQSNKWAQRNFIAMAGADYSANSWGTGLKLRFSYAHPVSAEEEDAPREIVQYRVVCGFFTYNSETPSKKTCHYVINYSTGTEFEVALTAAFGYRVPDIIIFEPSPPHPIFSAPGTSWEPQSVLCHFTLCNTRALPNGYVRHPLSILKLTDFEDGATLQRTLSLAVEGVSVSAQRHLAPGSHPPVCELSTSAQLLLAHVAFHDPDSALDYFLSDAELGQLGLEGNSMSNANLIRRYGAFSFKKLGSKLWNFAQKALPMVGTVAGLLAAGPRQPRVPLVAANYEYSSTHNAAPYDYQRQNIGSQRVQ